jgi:hypothetical protein
MLSTRTANFKTTEEAIKMKIDDNDKFVKQLTTPLKKFDMNFHFSSEEDKETSSFSFKNDLLDKKAYDFIKSKDDCLAQMDLDDSIPNNKEEEIDKNKEENSKKQKL